MIELKIEEYERLVKEADDNQTLRRIITTVAATIVILVLIFFMVKPAFDVWLDTRKFEIQLQKSKTEAIMNKEIMNLEKEGLTNEEYFEWLSVRE